MTSIGKKIINILIACTLLLSGSCTPGSCFEETNACVKASFYLETTGKLAAPDSLTLYGIGIDSIRYKKASRVQPALIPLNAADETCRFVIRINGINDTLSFFYSTYTHLISKECGYTFYHDLDSVHTTSHNIDSLIIKLRSVTTIDAPNIYIYY